MNSTDSSLLFSMVNEGLTSSTYSLSNLSLPSTGWLTTMAIKTCMVKVWTFKGMISKPFRALNGLIGLVIGCTTNGVIGTLLLVPISKNTKLGVRIWNQEKWFDRLTTQVDNFVHYSKLAPYYRKFTLLWTLE